VTEVESRARREHLLAERGKAQQLLADLTSEFDAIVEAAMDVSLDDEHDPEGAGIAFERQQLDAVVAMVRGRLRALDIAIEQLDSGTMPTCDDCGVVIPFERLEAQPTATKCVACAGRPRSRIRPR
jgi:DnaK suppressor protein